MRKTLVVLWFMGWLSWPIWAVTLQGKVIGVSDGDTITVLDENRVAHKVRLAGIDAPEKAQAFGDRSKKQIAVLDKEIEQIKRLKEQTQALLARKQVIESLQRDRAETVRLLSELVKQMPEGVYIRSLRQEGVKISLGGYAQSNARVSTLMRNIEASPWLEKPRLIEIKAVQVDKRRLNEFNLEASLKRAPVEEGGKK